LHGLYVEPYFTKGIMGVRIFHDSDYFKEKTYFHKDQKCMDKWINAIKHEAAYHDVTKKYDKLRVLGKGKFSTVFLCRSHEDEELLAMKFIDKK